MKRISIGLVIVFASLAMGARAQSELIYDAHMITEDGKSYPCFVLKPFFVFPTHSKWERYQRLIRNVKIVYPIAKFANMKMLEMEDKLGTIHSKKEQKKYIKSVEYELKAQYTPILRRMSFSQGKILIKLIDRETGSTSYQLVKEFRGGFRAFFWQGIARIFGANLKKEYGLEDEDQIIEEVIQLYEAGMI